MSSFDKSGAIEGGPRGRHMSVSNYESNVGSGNALSGVGADSGRRRSSIVPASGYAADPSANSNVLNQKDDTLRKMSVAVPNLAELTSDAQNASNTEKNMTLKEGLRLYPKAIFFSLILSLAVVMEGYDTWLLGNFFAQPAFARKYGEPAAIKDGVQTYEVAAKWQTGIGNATSATNIIGLLVNGILSERIGYRYTMLGSLIFITCVIFVTFFAKNVQMLLAGYILSGLPWGIFQTLTTTYAAEVTPVALRPILTTYVNLCWVMGQLIASGILKAFAGNTSDLAYRVPYAIQWVWPVPIFIGTFFAPESPWWLVRHGKLDQARKSLTGLTNEKNVNFNVEDTLAMMIHTNELEIQQSSGTTYWDCFKGVDLRRTEICSMVWLIQTISGSPMIGWGTYFMTKAGLPTSQAFSLGIAQSAMGFIGTVLSWFLMPHLGRRTLYIWGQVAMFLGLIVIGGLGIPPLSENVGWASGALLLILTFLYDLTVGPVCYCLVAEIPSTRLRIKTVVIARAVYIAAGFVVGGLMPEMMNSTAWNWRGKTGFFWAGTNLCGLVWTYFRLPEPKGLTFAELDVLFENKVSARKFRDVAVDPYRSDNLVIINEEEEIHDTKEVSGKY